MKFSDPMIFHTDCHGKCLNTRAVSHYFGVSVRTIRSWKKQGCPSIRNYLEDDRGVMRRMDLFPLEPLQTWVALSGKNLSLASRLNEIDRDLNQ